MTLEFTSDFASREAEITQLVTDSFTVADSAEEGAFVGQLVRDLMQGTPRDDVMMCAALDGNMVIGCVFFSRLRFEEDGRRVSVMAPVAVKTGQQNKGIGQEMILHGLEGLRKSGVDFVLTYGDPNYYIKTGFEQITADMAQPPLRLSMPFGWLGRPLSTKARWPLVGPSHCVAALNKPALW
ncbi:Predicted N-acetyltransferase YhbS [Sulfitobacter marinus]|uniref:Predicted N-acetyltransferase YhbS n=1 Tax=Sulfitobacter marinus TaxID=394264 RepID=A0A1I6RRC9_9RHOB|nr:N-acetyltransferase [Sulfitobacter marinus]SFS67170.1 Predicted N-acetyltransferase YhbS [Sulfitobacter marinus]